MKWFLTAAMLWLACAFAVEVEAAPQQQPIQQQQAPMVQHDLPPGPREIMLLSSGPPYWVNPTAAGITGSVDCYPVVSQSCYVTGTGLVPMSSLMPLSRASAETYTNASGVLSYAGSGVLASGNAGLQIWEASTNLILYSNSFTNGVWSNGGAGSSTLTPNAGLAPDGTVTATLWARQATGSTYWQQTLTKAATVLPYTYSLFVSKSVGNYAALRIQAIYPNRGDAVFNISNCTISTAAFVTGTFTSPSATVSSWPNGCLISLSITSDTSTTIDPIFSFNSNGGLIDGTDSVSNSAGYVAFAEFDQASFKGPYIPTTSTTAARAADAITATGALATCLATTPGSVYTQTNGVMGSPYPRLIKFGSNTWILGYASTSQVQVYNSASGTVATANAPSGTYATRAKIAAAYNGTTDKIVWGSGTQASGADNRSLATGTINLGSEGGSVNFIDGNLERLTCVPNYYNLLPTTGTGARLLDPANDNDFAWLYDLITERTAS